MTRTADGPHPRSTPSAGPAAMLTALLGDSLDPGYAEAAGRRGGSTTRARGTLAVVGVLILGLVLGVAYADARAAAPAGERTRLALLDDVHRDTARSAELQSTLERLRQTVADDRDAALAATVEGRRLSDLVARLQGATAGQAVQGPGATVTLADAAPAEGTDPVSGDPVDAVSDAGLVLDTDLQAVVNALWAAGAEAISVSGQRLAPTSSIRTAGEAILVDFRPVSSPYVIEAIGDPGHLVPRFVGSTTAQRYAFYSQAYGIGFSTDRAEELSLSAATETTLRYARADAAAPASTPAATPASAPASSAPATEGTK